MGKIIKTSDAFEERFLVLQLALAVIVIFAQVVMRYVFNSSLSWSEELARYLYIWQGWLGISLIERERAHIEIDMLKVKFHGVPRKFIETAAQLICVFASGVMAYVGVKMVLFSFTSGARSTALRIPLGLVYAAMPVGCILYCVRVIFHMLENLGVLKTEQAGEEG